MFFIIIRRKKNSNYFDCVIIYGGYNFLQLTQIYKGPIVNGCYHGWGIMTWIEENQNQIYEGNFYVNRLHGYGRMNYANGANFEVKSEVLMS